MGRWTLQSWLFLPFRVRSGCVFFMFRIRRASRNTARTSATSTSSSRPRSWTWPPPTSFSWWIWIKTSFLVSLSSIPNSSNTSDFVLRGFNLNITRRRKKYLMNKLNLSTDPNHSKSKILENLSTARSTTCYNTFHHIGFPIITILICYLIENLPPKNEKKMSWEKGETYYYYYQPVCSNNIQNSSLLS